MKSYISLLFMALACVFGMRAADVVTSEPSPLQESSKDVVIYFHADMGNKGLAGTPATTDVYAHTGVITNKSTSNSDWKHAPAKWGDNSPKYKLEYVSPNLWKLNMGDIRTYYGLTSDEKAVSSLSCSVPPIAPRRARIPAMPTSSSMWWMRVTR